MKLDQKSAFLAQHNVDSGSFYRFDPIKSAEDCGLAPTQGFRASSNSVKDCRLSAATGIRPRVKSRVGITGGYVDDADRSVKVDSSWAHHRAPRASTSKNARKRARRAH